MISNSLSISARHREYTNWPCWAAAFALLGLVSAAEAQDFSEDYVAGAASGWTNVNIDSGRPTALVTARQPNGLIDVNTWQIGRIITGTEAAAEPDPITGGNGPTVLTYDISERLNLNPATEEWDFFQKSERNFSFQQSQYDTHVVWLEFSSYSNFAHTSPETARLEINFLDAGGTAVSLQNNFSTNSGPRANQTKAKRAYTDGSGNTLDVLDSNLAVASANLNFGRIVDTGGFFNARNGQEDDDPNPSDADGSQKVLNTLFDQRAVVRLDDYRNFNYEIEWRTLNPDAGFASPTAPVASGDANWRSLKPVGALGSGTTFGSSPGGIPDADTLIVSSPIQSITKLSLTATRREVPGTEDGGIPDLTRANPKINVNQQGTSAGGDDNTFANQQIGLGKFTARVLHIGDINRDGQVTPADVSGTALLANFGKTTLTDTSVLIGNQQRDVVWSDGDAINDTKITVADAMVGVLANATGAAPTGPTLAYNSGSGNLTIQSNGASISGYSFLAAEGSSVNFGAYNDRGYGLESESASEIGWMNLTTTGVAAGSNLTGSINLGNVLPAGLSATAFEDFFSAAVFNIGGALTKAGSFFAVAPPAAPGDFNGDGKVDNGDLNLLLGNWGSPTVPAAWINGFVTPVDNGELNALLGNWGFGVGVAVPEPTAVSMMILAAGIALTGRSRS